MANYQHPASLNVLQQYAQACSILRNTSRASNPAWYQSALELPWQLHIRCDGPRMTSFYLDLKHKRWTEGPSLNPETLEDPAKRDALIVEILRHARAKGASSLGVLLHIADEFATAELKPELDNPAALPDLRDTAIHDPASILEDSSVAADQASWRVLPYPAAGSDAIATTVALSRQYEPLFAALRETSERTNFPLITQALSAPMVALTGLRRVLKPAAGKPFVAILQYPWFTAMAFFNEHADLRLIRTLQHRGVRRATNLRNALNTTNASLEFLDPDLFLVPLGLEVDDSLENHLRIGFPSCRVEKTALAAPEPLPAWCPEPAAATDTDPAAEGELDSHSFTILHNDRWAFQNFLPTPKDVVEIYPSRSDMKLLRMLRLSRVAVAAVAVLVLAYLAFGIIDLIRRPEWAFDPSQAGIVKSRLVKLTSERQKSDHWNNLLDDRSKAWAAMESLARMFSENGGMLVKSYSHLVKPESAAGQAKVGFIKEWKINGFARDEALEYLNNLNTREGINAHFSEIARLTGNTAYNPATGNRNITVNVRTLENGGFKPVPPEEAIPSDESTYPFTFDLTITQRFESTDPMALTVSKAP